MKKLNGAPIIFDEDWADYSLSWKKNGRTTSRGIIINDGKILLEFFGSEDFYVFPGGGVEVGERITDALYREVLEETGYDVIKSSVKMFGCTKMIKADYSAPETIFVGLAYYFFAQVDMATKHTLNLTDSEKKHKVNCVWVPLKDLGKIIQHNTKIMDAMKKSIDSGAVVDKAGFPKPRRYDYIYRETRVMDALSKKLGIAV